MQRRLKVFGSTHCPPPPPEAASPVEKPCHAEHEIVAQLLAEDDRGKTLPLPPPSFLHFTRAMEGVLNVIVHVHTM